MHIPDFAAATWLSETTTHLFEMKLPVAEKIIRPVIIYFAMVVFLRVFGKRELAQLNPFDFVVLLSVSNTVQNAIIGDDTSLTGGLIGAFALFAVNYVVLRFLFKHRRLDQIFEGNPTILVKGGKLQHKALAKELMTVSELLTVARRQGFDSLEEVDQCVLEPGGVFFIKGKIPTTDTQRFEILLARLDRLEQKISAK